MSLDIEFEASCGSTKVKSRVTTPMPTTNGDSGEAVTRLVADSMNLVATTATNLAMTTLPATSSLGVFPSTSARSVFPSISPLGVYQPTSPFGATVFQPTTPLGVFQPTHSHSNADTRSKVSISQSMDNMLMLDIYDLEGNALPVFAKRDAKISGVLERILKLTVGARDLVLGNYRGETLDLDSTLAECGVEDGEALWMVKKELETWSGVVAER